MDYFCYISRNKIDQMLENLEMTSADSWKESEATEQNASGKMSAGLGITGILNLFKGEASYGRKGTIKIEKEVKRTYLEKLRKVLEAIAERPGVFEFPSAVNSSTDFSHRYYHYAGRFFGENIVEAKSPQTVTVTSRISESTELLLDCSLGYFSESRNLDGSFNIHSANTRFFSGDIPLHFETVFMYLHHDDSRIFGTPLFLKLHDDDLGLFI